jgi:hypothetical protein
MIRCNPRDTYVQEHPNEISAHLLVGSGVQRATHDIVGPVFFSRTPLFARKGGYFAFALALLCLSILKYVCIFACVCGGGDYGHILQTMHHLNVHPVFMHSTSHPMSKLSAMTLLWMGAK